jgi:hypothetical protein
MNVREKIREQNRVKRMRLGQEAPELVTIPSMDGDEAIRVAMVPLTEAESQSSLILASSLDVLDNSAGLQARNRVTVQNDVWNACRDPEDSTKKVWPSVDEMVKDIEPTDVDWLFDQLTTLMDYASPAMDGLTEEDLAELKNGFALIDWNELTGRRWSALKLCLSILSPELLAARSRSFTSTMKSTTTSESDEST